MAANKMTLEEQAYNSQPFSWSVAWQTDPVGGELSAEWDSLIASFRSRTFLGRPVPDFTGELLSDQGGVKAESMRELVRQARDAAN